jgi:exonuclease III
MDMRFGTWNVRSMYRAGSLRVVAEEISKYKLDLVGLQEVRWGGGGTETAGEYTFFLGYRLHHSIVYNLLLPTLLVSITVFRYKQF